MTQLRYVRQFILSYSWWTIDNSNKVHCVCSAGQVFLWLSKRARVSLCDVMETELWRILMAASWRVNFPSPRKACTVCFFWQFLHSFVKKLYSSFDFLTTTSLICVSGTVLTSPDFTCKPKHQNKNKTESNHRHFLRVIHWVPNPSSVLRRIF